MLRKQKSCSICLARNSKAEPHVLTEAQAGGELRSRHASLAATIVWAVFAVLLLILLIALLLSKPGPPARFVAALIVTFSFAVAARLLHGVTMSGAAAGFLVTLILYVTDGPAMFGAVFVVFVLTYLATRFGRVRKQSRAIAEQSGGRDAAQVFANIGCAALIAAVAHLLPSPTLALNLAPAALAEAAADTVSGEVGKSLSGTARMITSWRLVPAGTNGAISLWGSVAGIVAASFVGVEIYFTRLQGFRAAIAASVAGVLGMFFDSLFGATLETRRMLTNNAVNFLSTAFSILAAMLLATFL